MVLEYGESVNFLAVVVASIASMAIGFVWYSPFAFGKTWMKLMGKSAKDMEAGKKKSNMPLMMGVNFISTLVMAFVLALFMQFTGASTPVEGAWTAAWAWLGFVATVTLSSVLWEGKPVKLYILNAAHYLVGMLVMGAIIAAWP
ncbi:MAG TPA: DUF1761 domain-containing protein [Candidatus Nanoarchaeia archaeon]|nr:DUF1761 domain-containing protein [Candidatus Nanoarchaeia archaeon]